MTFDSKTEYFHRLVSKPPAVRPNMADYLTKRPLYAIDFFEGSAVLSTITAVFIRVFYNAG